jgi:hypothetical protein
MDKARREAMRRLAVSELAKVEPMDGFKADRERQTLELLDALDEMEAQRDEARALAERWRNLHNNAVQWKGWNVRAHLLPWEHDDD